MGSCLLTPGGVTPGRPSNILKMFGQVVPVILLLSIISINKGQIQNRLGRRLDFQNFEFGLFRPRTQSKIRFPLSGFSSIEENSVNTQFLIPGLETLPPIKKPSTYEKQEKDED